MTLRTAMLCGRVCSLLGALIYAAEQLGELGRLWFRDFNDVFSNDAWFLPRVVTGNENGFVLGALSIALFFGLGKLLEKKNIALLEQHCYDLTGERFALRLFPIMMVGIVLALVSFIPDSLQSIQNSLGVCAAYVAHDLGDAELAERIFSTRGNYWWNGWSFGDSIHLCNGLEQNDDELDRIVEKVYGPGSSELNIMSTEKPLFCTKTT